MSQWRSDLQVTVNQIVNTREEHVALCGVKGVTNIANNE